MSSIFERVLDAFKLIRFQPNFKHSSIRACADHSKQHQGHQPQSGTSKSSFTPSRTLEMSLIFEGVLDAFKLIRFQPNFKHSSVQAFEDHPKKSPRTPAPVRNIKIIINSSQKSTNVINLRGGFLMPSNS